MTPTRSQLDAALPRVPSGIGAMAGDLTDDDDRAVALDWLEALYVRADLERLLDEEETWRQQQDHPPAPGITYYGRDDER